MYRSPGVRRQKNVHSRLRSAIAVALQQCHSVTSRFWGPSQLRESEPLAPRKNRNYSREAFVSLWYFRQLLGQRYVIQLRRRQVNLRGKPAHAQIQAGAWPKRKKQQGTQGRLLVLLGFTRRLFYGNHQLYNVIGSVNARGRSRKSRTGHVPCRPASGKKGEKYFASLPHMRASIPSSRFFRASWQSEAPLLSPFAVRALKLHAKGGTRCVPPAATSGLTL